MNVYQAFFNLKEGVKDADFCLALEAYMTHLETKGDLVKWRLLRRKLGLGGHGDFHLMMEFRNLAQLDQAFGYVATREGEVEEKHFCVNKMIDNISFSLYRDYPDPERKGEGLF